MLVDGAKRRDRLEHLCRYRLRPPVVPERLERLRYGDILLELKRRWSDGTTHLRLSPTELLERLAARPMASMVRPDTAGRRGMEDAMSP